MARRDQPLYRDPTDKMLGGVSSGLAQYFDIDTTLVRVAFVVLTLFGGGGILAYVILWVLLEPAPVAELPPPEIAPSAESGAVIDTTESAPVADIATQADPGETAPAEPTPASKPEPPSPTTS